MFNKTVREYLDLGKTGGEVGVEIEMELNSTISYQNIDQRWRVEGDGSLRGYGYELVLNQPCNRENVPDMVDLVKKGLKEQSLHIIPTIRAGVHIHLNMQEKQVEDVFKLMACYYLMETALTRFCGEGREGNLFCLRGRDATYAIEQATEAYQSKDLYRLRTQSLRYASLNVQSLFNYGSVEFRGLGTTADLENITVWCEILCRLKDYALSQESAWNNILDISGQGGRRWMTNIFGPELMKHLDYPDLEWDIIQDVRNAQYFCHQLNK